MNGQLVSWYDGCDGFDRFDGCEWCVGHKFNLLF